jgi:peptide/nickel transport system ATP-binding protein
MDTLVDISQLTIQFPEQEVPAVAGISFSIKRGEILALVGESGSGKSLTALSLLALHPKQSIITGSITAFLPNKTELLGSNNKPISSIRGREIAMIFQEPMTSLNPVLTCGNQVKEAVELHTGKRGDDAIKRVKELFEMVELPAASDMLNRYPHQLSGGQRQRVMIAMAMAGDPQLLIADEPTTALDVRVQKNILRLLKKLKEEKGLSILLITHDMGIVAEMADRVAVMLKGNIIETGRTNEVLRHPKEVYTKGLLACRISPDKKGSRLQTLSSPSTINEPLNAIPVSKNEFVKVRNLTVAYPAKQKLFGKKQPSFIAVNNVSFNIHEHEFVGLVGECGSGKSTLGRALLHLIKPTSGKVIIKGTDPSTLSESELRNSRRNFQIVFQDPYGSLHPGMTAFEAVSEPLLYHGISHNKKSAKEKVASLLESVQLSPDHMNRYPHQFSGGQRQRLSIARALSLEPRFLVFDESVSALDVSIQAAILNLINDLRVEYGFSALFISHDLKVVHYLCDRIMVMEKGKIVEQGRANQIFHTPGNAYTKELLAAML